MRASSPAHIIPRGNGARSLAVTLLVAAAASFAPLAEGQQGRCFDTITFRVANDDRLSFFNAAINDVSLSENLEGPGPLLVFAPTDKAFEMLKDDKEALELELRKLVEYHVATRSGYDRYTEYGGSRRISTLCGDDCPSVSVSTLPSGKILVNGRAAVVEEITTCNGLLVLIDEVLVPRQDQVNLGKEGKRRNLEVECSVNDPTCCDISPPEYSCAQERVWGKCNEPWMILDGYCRYTCGRCGDADEDKGSGKGQDPDCDYTYGREVRRRERKGRRGKKKARKKKNGGWKVSKYMKKGRSKATTLDDHYRARDPCRCTETGFSGHVDTHHRGCFTFRPRWGTWWTRSSERPNQICYVVDPHACEASRESRYYPGAKWRTCHK